MKKFDGYSDRDQYDELYKKEKISKAEYDWYKKFDNEYYRNMFFENPLNDQKDTNARIYKQRQALKVDNVQYDEILGYMMSEEEYHEVQADMKDIGSDGHIRKRLIISNDLIASDPSQVNIEKVLKDLVTSTILAIKYNRKTNRQEQEH